jgi:hypothetical protein
MLVLLCADIPFLHLRAIKRVWYILNTKPAK